MATLFDPVIVGKLELANRIVMAPMTRSRAGPAGTATPLMALYYAQRASAGLIITEATQPSPVGQGYLNTPGLHSQAQLDSWRQVTSAVHAAGGRIFAQLQHAGRVSHADLLPADLQPVGPSSVRPAVKSYTTAGFVDCPIPLALTIEGVLATRDDFVAAARNAIDAGFDGVELQAANGFLLTQFLNAHSNQRADRYGGRLQNRLRFPVEVTEAVADAIGPERVGLKVSPGSTYNDIDPRDDAIDYPALVQTLPDELAYLHVAEKGNRALTLELRRLWHSALILNPYSPEALELGDAFSFGTLFVSNPDLPARLRAGGPFNAAVETDFYGGGEKGYTDYATVEG